MPKSMGRDRYYPVSRKRFPAQQDRGFTIMEAAIAMVVMMVAVLGSASLFAYSIQNNSAATDRELAMALAQQQLEQLRNVAFTDARLNATGGRRNNGYQSRPQLYSDHDNRGLEYS